MDRWIEEPPDDYLMFLPVWIRLRNIPVNHYTEDTIKEIAESVGQVIGMDFDPEKAQSQDYVRVRILFDVLKPLKNSKELQLPNGYVVKIGIDYERIRKRCFQCQRLSHDKASCPFNPLNSKPSEVANSDLVSKDSIKGKEIDLTVNLQNKMDFGLSLLPADILNHNPIFEESLALDNLQKASLAGNSFTETTSDLNHAFSMGSFSGVSVKQKNPCRKPRSWSRKPKSSEDMTSVDLLEKDNDYPSEGILKRKAQDKGKGLSKCPKKYANTVVPDEPPKDQ